MSETNNDIKTEENTQNSNVDGNIVPTTTTDNTNQPQLNSGKFYYITLIIYIIYNDYIKYFIIYFYLLNSQNPF